MALLLRKKVGSASITAKAGDKTATCAITVEVTPVVELTLDKTLASLKAGETVTLTATITPSTATDTTIIWSSSDAAIASVTNGVVTANEVGSATITAKVSDKTASCVITVEKTPVSAIEFDKVEASLKVGETTTITATITPSTATDKTITWSSSDATIASVSNGVVTANKVGSAIITAKAGDQTATCTITVEGIPVTEITLNKDFDQINVGENITIKATIVPSTATDQTITWSSSNAAIASVSNGVVTGKAVGTTTITAKAGDKTASCSISVCDVIDGHGYVDLGLPSHRKWATCNVGASRPEEYGKFYMWGDINSSTGGNTAKYKYYKKESAVKKGYTKYVRQGDDCAFEGYYDNLTELSLTKDDMSYAAWGKNYRTPSVDDWEELTNTNYCTWTWVTYNNISGYKVTSKMPGYTDRWIFLPASGYNADFKNKYGKYWSRNLSRNSSSCYAESLDFKNGAVKVTPEYRYYGMSVRPVFIKEYVSSPAF